MNNLFKRLPVAILVMLVAATTTVEAGRYSWRSDSTRDYGRGIYSSGYNNNYRVPGYSSYYRPYYGPSYSSPRYYNTPPAYYRYNYQYEYQYGYGFPYGYGNPYGGYLGIYP